MGGCLGAKIVTLSIGNLVPPSGAHLQLLHEPREEGHTASVIGLQRILESLNGEGGHGAARTLDELLEHLGVLVLLSESSDDFVAVTLCLALASPTCALSSSSLRWVVS